MSIRTRDILFSLFVLTVVGGLIFFFFMDFFYYHLLEQVQDLFFVAMIAAVVFGFAAWMLEYKNLYLRLTLEKLVSAETEIGISSYVNAYVEDVKKNDIFSIRRAYQTLEKHLRRNYYFRINRSDYVRVLDSIFKSGDSYCISLATLFPDLRKKLLVETGRINLKAIVSDAISSVAQNQDLIGALREADMERVTWRKGNPKHVFNIIISLKRSERNYLPVRALKFETAAGQDMEMYVVTDTESLGFWYNYFERDFKELEDKVKKAISKPIGSAEVMKAIIEICDNYSDLYDWLEHVIRKKASDPTITRAIDDLRRSDGYSLGRVSRICEIHGRGEKPDSDTQDRQSEQSR